MPGNVFRLAVEPVMNKASPKSIYDVVIVGAGVVGCALARRFSQSGLAVAVVDRASDVGEGGASKSNSAIAHCGFDADPGSLEAKLVISASKRWPTLAKHLKIPLQSTGALMVARNEMEMESVMKYYKRSLKNGIDDVELLDEAQIRKKEPFIFEGEKLLGALHIPREDVVDPFAACHAFAETALVQGDCDFYFQAEVDSIKQDPANDKYAKVIASKQSLELVGRTVINSAGLGAQRLAEEYGGKAFTLNPRRGQFLVFDNLSKSLLNKILLPVPGPLGKGILITPTIFGNLLAGPTAEDLPMNKLQEGTQTTLDGLELVRSSVFKSLPRLQNFGAVAQYAGARSNCQEGNYLFQYGDGPNNSRIVTLAGIRSTGLSASFAIADEVFEQMEQRKLISPKRTFVCEGRDSYPTWYERQQSSISSHKQERRTTVCFCEGVDKQDIQRTLESPLVPSTTDAIKRRTRATTGRCQGFNCLVDVCKTIASSRSLPVKSISKRGPGTEWFPNYVDTAPLAYDRKSKVVKSELFSRAHLYDSVADPSTAWNHDEPFDVVVIGAGPAGCGAIAGLASSIHIDKVLVLERSDRIGGIPARYPNVASENKKTFIHFSKGKMVSGSQFAEELRNEFYLSPFGSKINLKLHSTVMQIDYSLSPNHDDDNNNQKYPFRIRSHDGSSFRTRAVIVATGARESTAVERKSVTGHRPAAVVFTNHLLSVGGIDALVSGDSLVVGSGLVPRSIIQSDLNASSSGKMVTYLATPQDEKPWISHMYFGGGPAQETNGKEQRIMGWNGTVERVGDNKSVSSLVLGGCLVPNSEMLIRSSIIPSSPPKGIYLIGNVAESRFGPWPGVACYLHAKHVVARQVLQLFK